MRDTIWFRAIMAGTFYRIFARHMRWINPKRPENENERRISSK